MTNWAQTVERIAASDDLHIAPFRADGVTYGTPTWIWSVVAAAFEGLADDGFGLALGVDVGGIHWVDAGIKGMVNDTDGGVVVRVADGPEHHGAQGERADFDAGGAEIAVVSHAFAP